VVSFGALGWLWRALAQGDARVRPIGSVVAVVFGTLMTSLFARDFGISLADLRGAYGLSADEANWLNTLTNASQLLTAPVVPLMVVIFGPRRVLMHSALAFIAVTLWTPFAVGLPLVFFLHFCIGLLQGCFVPATLAIVFANLSPRYWLIALGIYSVRLTLALHTGVSLSGWFVEHLGWQAIYWQASLFAAAFLFLAAISFHPRAPNWGLFRSTNKGEFVMYCAGLTMVYAGLDQGNRLDWFASGTVVGLMGGGLLLVAAAVVWQFLSPQPFAHPTPLLRRNVYLAMLIVTLFGTMSAATSYLIPNFLGTVAHLKPEQSGTALWWVDAVQLVAIPLTIWSIRHGDIRFSLAVGLVLVLVGCWMGNAITHDWRADDFAWMSIALGMGNSAVLLSCIAITVANTPREDLISLVAYIQIPRVIGPELAAAVLATVVRRAEGAHSLQLTGWLDPARAQALGLLPGAWVGVIRREAFVLAFADAYRFCFWVAALGLALACFLKATPPHPLTRLPQSGPDGAKS
jgi:DHA2 family multidrug resistance protein